MPLLRVTNIEDDVKMGFWHISTEDEESIIPTLPAEIKEQILSYKSAKRRSEIIATYALLHSLTGNDDVVLKHEKSGRPILEGYNVSISHTKGLAAVILSKTHNVAIDVEYISERVNKVAHVFLRTDEEAPSTESRLIHWCAKETLYKLLSEEDLRFEEMRVEPFSTAQNDCLTIEDMRSSKLYKVYYKLKNDFVMTVSY